MDAAVAVVVEATGVVDVAVLTTIVVGVEAAVDTTMETAEDTITIVAAVVTITTTAGATTIVVEADTIIAAEAAMGTIAEDMEETAGTDMDRPQTMASNPHGSSTSHLNRADMAVLLRLDGRPLHLLDGMVVVELDMEAMIVDHRLSISNPLSNDLLGCKGTTVAHLRLVPTTTTR
jgi:hypothetical protein